MENLASFLWYYCLKYMTCVKNIFYFYQGGPYSPTDYITPILLQCARRFLMLKYSPTVGYKN